MRASRTAAFPLVIVVLAVPACGFGAPSQVLPGLAHPMASADSGFHVTDTDTLHDYNGINLVLPAGWHVDVADNCLSPPGVVSGPGGGCPAAALRIRPEAAEDGVIDSDGADLEDPDKWRRPWASCPQNPGASREVRAEDAEITEHGEFTLVSGEQAEYSEWTVTCTGGGTFRTRAWYVAEADLEFDVPVMLDTAADGYDAIVHSTDLSRYKALS